MVRYYGYYSNVSRGQGKKQNQDGLIPRILEPEESSIKKSHLIEVTSNSFLRTYWHGFCIKDFNYCPELKEKLASVYRCCKG